MIERSLLSFDGQFTQIPNAWVRDERLSRKARGLLAELLSHDVGWRTTQRALEDAGTEGREALLSAVRELQTFGYLTISQAREDGSRFGEAIYTISDPFDLTVSGKPTNGKTRTTGNPYNGLPAPIRIQREEHQECVLELDQDPKTKSIERDADFDRFWDAYGLKVGKRDAEKAWRAARRRAKPAAILAGLDQALEAWEGTERRYRPHPATWLNRDGWADEDHVRRGGSGRRADPVEVERRLREMEASNGR